MTHETEKEPPHRVPEVMGLESVGSIGHIEVEGRAIREPFGGTRTLNRKP